VGIFCVIQAKTRDVKDIHTTIHRGGKNGEKGGFKKAARSKPLYARAYEDRDFRVGT